jgi:hypothetical protein
VAEVSFAAIDVIDPRMTKVAEVIVGTFVVDVVRLTA